MEVRGSAALKPSGCSRVSCTIRITVWPPGVNNHPTKTRATQATEMPKRTDPDIRENEFIDGGGRQHGERSCFARAAKEQHIPIDVLERETSQAVDRKSVV